MWGANAAVFSGFPAKASDASNAVTTRTVQLPDVHSDRGGLAGCTLVHTPDSTSAHGVLSEAGMEPVAHRSIDDQLSLDGRLPLRTQPRAATPHRELVDRLKDDIRQAQNGDPAALKRLQTFAKQNNSLLERLQALTINGADTAGAPPNAPPAQTQNAEPAPSPVGSRQAGQLPAQLLELVKVLLQLLGAVGGQTNGAPQQGSAAGNRSAPAGPTSTGRSNAATTGATRPQGTPPNARISGGSAAVPSSTPTGRGTAGDFLRAALAQKGDRYVFGAETRLNDPNPHTFDCSELVQWAAHQAGVKIPDGSANQLAHVRKHGTEIPVAQALKTPGALLFRPGHVAISLGDGRTIEARGRKHGVGVFSAKGRFMHAGLIPGMRHK